MKLDQTPLTHADIRSRCTEVSFNRGQHYYADGAIAKRLRPSDDRLEAWVSGTELYRVEIWVTEQGRLETYCSCPYDWGGDCKHIVAVLLAWLNEPDSFQPPVDLKSILKKWSKAALIELLLDIFRIYPDLVDDLDIIAEPDNRELTKKASALFDKMYPWGHLSESQVETQLRMLARRANKLARRGQAELARRVY